MMTRLSSALPLTLALSLGAAACVAGDDGTTSGLNEGQITSAIELDNGRVLTFAVAEGESTYAIEGTNHAPKRPVPAAR